MELMLAGLPPISQMTVEALKVKLSFHVGTNPSSMVLQLLNESGTVVAPFLEDSRKLGV
jgi:tubulin-folding cofactor B